MWGPLGFIAGRSLLNSFFHFLHSAFSGSGGGVHGSSSSGSSGFSFSSSFVQELLGSGFSLFRLLLHSFRVVAATGNEQSRHRGGQCELLDHFA